MRPKTWRRISEEVSAISALTAALLEPEEVLADAGDPFAGAILETGRRAMGQLLVGLVNTFNPELIVIGGSVAMGEGERLFGAVREAVTAGAFRIPRGRVRIVPAELGDDVGLLGAVALCRLGASPA